ncbi:hypothetical protein K437DRAFT_240691 [Tilletiaria anomala UBC 951]|uniref:AB hydrolase-1 domain-containing protein n=1 Tax=Tilletiaria anomala (strain ATCC 24038 / CBS 436.72 / UBC 951) TaxID=1037660 RepID=A0A066V6Q2_TILAU|nr:uncharacterized protein K437DRAFT_240691 [Tilletiaria anomala UBC 951]KDN37417.1 hypothetical protein K437DRAFT_240691 [Tilletiaria anomala UBC 951]
MLPLRFIYGTRNMLPDSAPPIVHPDVQVLDDYTVPKTDPHSTLLPLLQADPSAPHARSPPLHNLPGGRLSECRIAFRTTRKSQATAEHIDWISTTHTFPAAYPRSHDFSTTPLSAAIRIPKPIPSSALASPEAERAYDAAKRAEDAKFWKENIRIIDDMQTYYPPKTQKEALKIAEERAGRKDPQLWNVIQRIVPVRHDRGGGLANGKSRREPVTLLLAHATGFHKEIYEPFLKYLGQLISDKSFDVNGEVEIEEIWSIDTMISGESAILNGDSLGEAVSWADAARDLVQFTTNYIPPLSPSSASSRSNATCNEASARLMWPPTVLARTYHPAESQMGDATVISPSLGSSPATSAHASRPNARRRRIIGLGHSYAGAAMALASNAYPDIFERVILVDPILISPDFLSVQVHFENEGRKEVAQQRAADKPNPIGLRKSQPLALSASTRKDTWRDRRAAEAYFNSRAFFKAWDPAVLASHIQYGIVPLSAWVKDARSGRGGDDGGLDESGETEMVTLAMPKFLEASSFSASWNSSYAYAALLSGRFRQHHMADTRKGRTYFMIMEQGSRSLQLETFEGEMEGKKPAEEGEPALRGRVEMVPGGHLIAQEQPSVLAAKVLEYILDGETVRGGSTIPTARL